MARPPPKLPRRHAQRQALNHGRVETSPSGPPSRERPRLYKPLAKKKKRSSTPSDDDDSDSGSDSNNDSGYNSADHLNAEAKYYRQKEAEFKAAGPTLSNLSEEDKKQIRVEERKWEL